MRVPLCRALFSYANMATSTRPIRGVIFDMDGTLTKPVIDFREMRRRLNVWDADVLEVLEKASPSERKRMESIICEVEQDALKNMQIMPGIVDVCQFLDETNIPRGLITRNTSESVVHFHENCFPLSPFSPALCRAFEPYKPHPAGIHHICDKWGIDPQDCVMIGDCAENDIVCGNRAGSMTVLLDQESQFKDEDLQGDMKPSVKISCMTEVKEILQGGILTDSTDQ